MVNFVVDSTFGISREYAEQNNIKTVALTVTVGDREFEEGYPDTWGEFYSLYATSKNGGKTSQPSPEKFVKAISQTLEEDPDGEIIVLTISERLSGTASSARVALQQFDGKKIWLFSTGAGPSSFMIIRLLVEARDSGASFEQIKELAVDCDNRIAMQFIPESLTELARGGRVNKLISTLGNILKLKPVFEFARNELKIYSKSLGFNRAADAAIEHMPKKYDRILLYYIGDDRRIEVLKERMSRTIVDANGIEVVNMCAVGAVHVGVGTVGIVTLASK